MQSPLEIAIQPLIDGEDSKRSRETVETMLKIFRNMKEEPNNPQFREIRVQNKNFESKVWRFRPAREFLILAGWVPSGEKIFYQGGKKIDEAIQILLDKRSLIKPNVREWDEESKVILPNEAALKEEELRRKALEEKEKEIAEFKKEQEERKLIAEAVRLEHRHDMVRRRSQNANPNAAFHRPSITRRLGGDSRSPRALNRY